MKKKSKIIIVSILIVCVVSAIGFKVYNDNQSNEYNELPGGLVHDSEDSGTGRLDK